MKIVYRENADPDLIKKLEERLGTAAVQEDPADPLEAYLLLDSEGLSLNRGPLSMEGSFSGMKKRLKKSNLEHELILRAVRIREKKTLRILDATAGMGEDALLLSACGHKLDLYEKDPVIGSLLEDAVRRGTEDPDLKDAASRMAVHLKDSMEDMRIAGGRYDVICLDPMFPKRTKSADVKKKFQLINELEQPLRQYPQSERVAFTRRSDS